MTANFFKHESALVEDAVIGTEVKVWHVAQIRSGAVIGQNSIIGKNVFIDAGVHVGENVKIQNNVSVYHGVTLENGVFVGPHVVFTNDKYPRAVNPDLTIKSAQDWDVGTILVKNGASIGAHSVIVTNVTIGEWAMVGAGSVVTRDVADQALVVGNPARLVGWVCRCGKIISREVKKPKKLYCADCKD